MHFINHNKKKLKIKSESTENRKKVPNTDTVHSYIGH